MGNISQNIQQIRQHIPHSVTLLCVSKFQPLELILEAYDAGERDFGESRVQELMEKQAVLPKDIRWHFIGHLQTNKVKYILPFVHLIHSVDSIKLLQTIEKEAAKANRIVNVLLELHVAREATKTGFAPDELPGSFDDYPHVRVCGIMGMATNTDDEEEIRRCFRLINSTGRKLGIDSPIVSMGMSGDYELAIEEGSNMVRVGSSIFGDRHPATPKQDETPPTLRPSLLSVLICFLLFFFESFLPAAAAREARIYGYVVDEKNVGLELVNVYLNDGVTGTSTNRNGYYSLTVPMSDTITVIFSMLGYTTLKQQVYTDRDVLNINVVLPEDNNMLEDVEVRGLQRQTGMMEETEASIVRLMPDATGGSIESLLITFTGVSQNNELSTQYNVRGGSFDENSVYVNGMEIHRPLLIRSGQQEGLSFVNTNMVDKVEFSAGGFNAMYGDRMSSVLDIQYKRPQKLESSLSVSLLGANAYVGWGDSLQSQMHGIRYKTSKYMLGALPTKGNYQPTFVDYQTYMTWQTGKKTERSKWEMNFLGNFSLNNYTFVPDSLSEGFGTYTQAMHKSIWYQGQEKDRFITAHAAVSAHGEYQLGSNERMNILLTAGGFYTHEQETYDILGEYVLSEQSLDGAASQQPTGESISGNITDKGVLGTGNSHEHARNRLQAGVVTLSHRGDWKKDRQIVSWGAQIQAEIINDLISEWEWRDSAGYSMPTATDKMELLYTLKGTNRMATMRAEGYVQDEYRWHTDAGSVTLNGGVRFNYWTFNNELLVSPRANVVWMPGWKRDFTFRFATGLYYQSPFYKELRDTVTVDGVTRIKLNSDLKAQRSVHALFGADYYFRAWGRPFKFTSELYAKYIDRMVSYSVDNVRVRYSGKNDSYGYTLGADLKLYGELVPGVDSWVSLSLMRSRMHLNEDSLGIGWIPTPQEQRWAVTFFFQDYIPRLPQYRLHLKFVFSEGLPFGYPRSASMRYLGRLSAYKRIDLGLSRTFSAATDRFMRKPSAKHVAAWSIYFEVFNVVGWKNVNSYYWLSAADGTQWASPNYLTGRMYNLRLSVDLQ